MSDQENQAPASIRASSQEQKASKAAELQQGLAELDEWLNLTGLPAKKIEGLRGPLMEEETARILGVEEKEVRQALSSSSGAANKSAKSTSASAGKKRKAETALDEDIAVTNRTSTTRLIRRHSSPVLHPVVLPFGQKSINSSTRT